MEQSKRSLLLEDQRIWEMWNGLHHQAGEKYFNMIEQGVITIGENTLKFKYFIKGVKPAKGYTLLFGFHGGGSGPAEGNDQQFQNHLHLYDEQIPDGVIWFVPRACQDAWDMWFHGYLPEMFSIIIKGFVFKGMVDPNKVFISGYSAGGDGIYHLGPMMADQLAGAAMMAGHPNGVDLYNVRNIAFSIQVGQNDSSYNRNKVGQEYIDKMKQLEGKYGSFSQKYSQIVQGCSHWMKKKDADMFGNFLREERNPYPHIITFKQHLRLKKPYFYYIEVDPEKHKELLVVFKKGNTFYIESEVMPVCIYVNRLMVDGSKEVQVFHNGDLTNNRIPRRSEQMIAKSIEQRGDPDYIFEDCFISNPHNGRVPLVFGQGDFIEQKGNLQRE